MAHEIMKQYHIGQAELMEEEDKIARAERGGISALVKHQAWVNDLVCAIRKFFDCSAYSTIFPDNIEWTFYGVVGYTVSTAMAFEPVHNQIQTWAEKYPTVATRNSYSLGVSDGLCRLAEEEKLAMENIAMETEQNALAARIRAEDIQMQVELDRICNPPPSPSPEPLPVPEEEERNNEGEHAMDFDMDAAGELKKFIKSEPKVEPEFDSSMLYEEPDSPPATQKPREDPARPSENEDESKKSTAARPREKLASKE
ncbi:MAG: hypothetical protein Q9161_008568 [Pseudevernia consocians]